jgi:hypothetical protein
MEWSTTALEGLDLGSVEPGSYRLICLPLKIVGSGEEVERGISAVAARS